jgi:hypothetical protein
MSPIEAAVAAIESLGPNKKFSYRQIAIQYGCDRTTLAWQRINRPSTHTKSRSFYAISSALQSKAYHLHEL